MYYLVQLTLTIWGEKAKESEAQWQGCPVIAVKKGIQSSLY
jgi:hypothetical protein